MRRVFLAVIPVLLSSACVTLPQYQALETQYTDMEKRNQDLVTEMERLQKEKSAAEAVLQRTQQESTTTQESKERVLQDLEQTLNECQTERDRLERQVKQEKDLYTQERDGMSAKEKDAQSRALEAEEQLQTLRKDLEDLHKKFSELQDARAQDSRLLDGMKAKLDKDLAQWIGQKKVAMVLDEEGLRITLMDAVGIEDDGKARVRVEAYDLLFQIASLLLAYPERNFYVIGHTDSVPIQSDLYPTNWELSVARAVEVVHYLQDEEKIDPKRLVASGCGPHRPLEDNATPEGRAKNRRVDILIPRICR